MALKNIYTNEICTWIDVESPDSNELKVLMDQYGIEKLLLDDSMEPNHLPKFEEHGNLKFFLTREYIETERENLNTISDISTKLSIFIIDHFIITVHRTPNQSIYACTNEIICEDEMITPQKIALNLALKVMKSYDDQNKKLIDKMDELENEIFLNNLKSSYLIRRLYTLKRKAALSARLLGISGVWIRAFSKLQLNEGQITDLYDKHKDVIADFDHLNGQASNLIAMYMAFSDQKANQVMKLLAIYSVYFLPITFLAGIYGMNFEHMPELAQQHGYYIVLAAMAIIVIITFFYFRKKRW